MTERRRVVKGLEGAKPRRQEAPEETAGGRLCCLKPAESAGTANQRLGGLRRWASR